MHYENLKLYESLDLKIAWIYRGTIFEESAWQKNTYVNTKLRIEVKQSGNNFEVYFFQASEQFCLWLKN